MRVKKLAVVSSSPFPNQVPVWRALAQRDNIEVKVFYATLERMVALYSEEDFETKVSWDIDLTSGYEWEVLENRPRTWLNWRFRFDCPSIKEKLARGSFDALLLVGKEYRYYLQAVKAAKDLGIPIIFMADTPPKKKNTVLSVAAFLHRKLFYRQISAFLTVSKKQKDYYLGYGVSLSKMFWAPYCVDNDFFQKQQATLSPLRDELRQRYGFKKSTKVIAFVGRFAQIKRPMDLLKAFECIGSKGDFGLLFVGDGFLKKECEQYAAKKGIGSIVFAGFKNRSEISKAYVVADCVVLPSESETWGLVVNEAMNFGLPIIASDRVGAVLDLVRAGQNGYVFPMGNTEQLAYSIMKLFETSTKALEMGKCSKEIILDYSVQARTDGVVQAFENICKL